MSTIALKQQPQSALIMLLSVVALAGTFLVWTLWMRSDAQFGSFADWSSVSWQIAQVDERGRLIRLGSHPFALAALLGFVSAASMSFAYGALQLLGGGRLPARNENDGLASRLEQVGQELDEEVFAVMRLLKQHLDFSGTHSEALAKVSRNLVALTSPEQIKAVIQFLLSENAKVQNEVRVLTQRLQQSQQQMEKLRTSLSDSQKLGMLDAVTMLKNRHWLEAHLPKEVQAAAEANEPLSLLVADVDHFKRINDSFGHAVGDEILRRFAELLSKNIKGRDTAVRYGGEEFVVVLPMTTVDGAQNLGEQIRTELQSKRWMHHKTGQQIGKVTASFGAAQLREGEDSQSLFERADAKLYEAKGAGRNKVLSDT